MQGWHPGHWFRLILIVLLSLTLVGCNSEEEEETPDDIVRDRDEVRPSPTPPPIGTPDPGSGVPVWITSLSSRLSNGYYPPGTTVTVDVTFSSPLTIERGAEMNFIIGGNLLKGKLVFESSYRNVHQIEVVLPDQGLGGRLCIPSGTTMVAEGESYSGGPINWEVPDNSFCPNYAITLSRNDSFNDGEITSQWVKFDNDLWDQDGDGIVNNEPNETFRVENGELLMSTQGRRVWGHNHFFSSLYMNNLQGDFDVSIKVSSMTRERDHSQAGFMLANDIENLYQNGLFLCSVTAQKGIMISWQSRENGKVNKKNFTGQSLFPVWLRLKKLGRFLYCYYRYDTNSDWTLHAKGRRAVSVDSIYDVGLYSTTDKGKPGEFIFDDFSFVD